MTAGRDVAALAAVGPVTVRDVDGPGELTACNELYAEVMGLRAQDGGLNPRLLVSIQRNGGYVVGAFAADRLVGFAFCYPAWGRTAHGPDPLYHYSQLAVVAPDLQNQGIGRLLKAAQRDRALADGITRMRWSFDPHKTRNAHFNLDVLGGRLIELVPAMYGSHGFGHDSDDESDRFVVEWRLDEPPRHVDLAPSAARLAIGQVQTSDQGVLVALPDHWEQHRLEHPDAARALRRRLRRTFAELLDDGYVGVSCQRTDAGVACYLFTREGHR